MNKFKENDRVLLLSKSCGEVKSLNSMLENHYVGKMRPPTSGVVTSFHKDHHQFGDYYSVMIDDYNEEIHRFRQYCFKEFDLMGEWESMWEITDDLFFI